MEEEVTEADLPPQTEEPVRLRAAGTQSEMNGALPGTPYQRSEREGTLDVVESPVREPLVQHYPTEYSQQYG